MLAQILRKMRTLVPYLLSLYIVPLLLLVASVAASLLSGSTIADFLRDPAATMERHPFIGMVSNAGVLLWTATATICLFSWSIIRHSRNQKPFAVFLFYSALLTVLLLLDDLFLLHEVVFPDYLGIPEKLVYIAYGSLALFWAVKLQKCIRETEYLILLTSFAFFGLSVFIDMFEHPIKSVFGGGNTLLLEDGFKLLGIAGWFGYFLRLCLNLLRASNDPTFDEQVHPSN